jgi:hypothetical protein
MAKLMNNAIHKAVLNLLSGLGGAGSSQQWLHAIRSLPSNDYHFVLFLFKTMEQLQGQA